MKTIEAIVCIILAIVLVVTIAIIILSSTDTVSINCRRACEHIDGPAWVDCVVMCEDKAQ